MNRNLAGNINRLQNRKWRIESQTSILRFLGIASLQKTVRNIHRYMKRDKSPSVQLLSHLADVLAEELIERQMDRQIDRQIDRGRKEEIYSGRMVLNNRYNCYHLMHICRYKCTMLVCTYYVLYMYQCYLLYIYISICTTYIHTKIYFNYLCLGMIFIPLIHISFIYFHMNEST